MATAVKHSKRPGPFAAAAGRATKDDNVDVEQPDQQARRATVVDNADNSNVRVGIYICFCCC
jgi:hypothetical protein